LSLREARRPCIIWLTGLPAAGKTTLAREISRRLETPRPVVRRNGMLIVRADERMELADGEKPGMRKVRFRTLGCWPLTGAVESKAADVAAVLRELRRVRTPERSWRAVDRPATEAADKRER